VVLFGTGIGCSTILWGREQGPPKKKPTASPFRARLNQFKKDWKKPGKSAYLAWITKEKRNFEKESGAFHGQYASLPKILKKRRFNIYQEKKLFVLTGGMGGPSGSKTAGVYSLKKVHKTGKESQGPEKKVKVNEQWPTTDVPYGTDVLILGCQRLQSH